jgi:hypothetical protein
VRHPHVHLVGRTVDERDLDLVALGDDHRLRDAGPAVELAVDRVGPHARGRLVGGDLRHVLVDVEPKLLDVTRRRRRKRRVGALVLLDVAVEARGVAGVVVCGSTGCRRLLRRRLCHDLLVVAATERDDEADGRDRGPRGEHREQQREAVADVGPLGTCLELVDALVVELLDGGFFE